MAVPKRRSTSTRRDKRRSHDALRAVAPAKCKSCGEPKVAHRVCPHCGQYKGVAVMEVEN